MFHEQGEPTESLENVKKYLAELQQMDMFTRDFCAALTASNMFTPMNMRVRQAEQIRNINGCYVINEERLNSLSVDRFVELRDKRYLPAIYAHLVSLAQVERLLMLKDDRPAVQAAA